MLIAQLETVQIVSVVVSTAGTVIVAVIGWSLRRLIRENDDQHTAISASVETSDHKRDEMADRLSVAAAKNSDQAARQIGDLAAAVAAEREARHGFQKQQDDRVWALAAELKGNYPERRETMRQFGTMIQRLEAAETKLGSKLDATDAKLTAKIDRLPCVGPRVPETACPAAAPRREDDRG